MTIWKARLSKEGDRVLCGWTNALGRYGCNGTIGWVIEDYGVRGVEFQPIYRQERPYDPNTEALPLAFDAYSKSAWEREQLPLPGRRLPHTREGDRMIYSRRFALPVTAPCPGPQCHRMNLISDDTLTLP